MSWVGLTAEVPSPLVQTLDATKQGIEAIVTTIETVTSALKTIIETIIKFVVVVADAEAAAIRAIAEAALLVLDDIEKNARQLYVLPVMPVDPNQLVGDWGGIQGLIGNNMTLSDGTRTLLEGNAGNAGFIRTVAASMEDGLDDNRPRFDKDSIVGGAVLVAGADTYYRAIALIKKLQSMFSSEPYPILSIDDNSLPFTRNLRAIPVAPTGANFYGVKLSWAPEPVANILALYGNPKYDIREVVIYRSSWDKVLPRNDYARYEVVRIPYTGLETSWIDTDFPNELGLPAWVYYGVGFTLNEVHEDGSIVEIAEPYSIRRTAICLGPGALRPAKNMGVPPDWVSVGLFDLIPPLGQALDNMRQFIVGVRDANEAAVEQIKKLVEQLEAELQRYQDFVDELTAIIRELTELLTFPEGYFGLSLLGPMKGGNEVFLQALKDAMTDVDDENRPPFDKGTEIVAGVVILLGVTESSGVPALTALLDTMAAIFGGVADEATAAKRAIDEASAAAEEQICLNDALLKKVCEAIESPSTLLGDNLEPALKDPLCS